MRVLGQRSSSASRGAVAGVSLWPLKAARALLIDVQLVGGIGSWWREASTEAGRIAHPVPLLVSRQVRLQALLWAALPGVWLLLQGEEAPRPPGRTCQSSARSPFPIWGKQLCAVTGERSNESFQIRMAEPGFDPGLQF